MVYCRDSQKHDAHFNLLPMDMCFVRNNLRFFLSCVYLTEFSKTKIKVFNCFCINLETNIFLGKINLY